MMRFRLAILLCALALAQPARSGAWLRDAGETFLSFETRLRHMAGRIVAETDLYLDRGLTPRLSGGLTAFGDGMGGGHATAFLRLPLTPPDRVSKLAVQIDLGGHRSAGRWRPMTRATLAWGRSFRWGDGYGWSNIEAAHEYRAGTGPPIYKLDATLGRSSGARVRPMVKLGVAHIPGQPLTWTGSAHLLAPGPAGITWVMGIERKRAGPLSTAVTLGLWRQF